MDKIMSLVVTLIRGNNTVLGPYQTREKRPLQQ